MWRGDDLTAAEFRTYLRALQRPHERRITAEIQDLDGNLLRHLTLQVLDGQVDCDVTAETSRVLSLRFVDQSRALQFEPDSPSGAPLHRSRLIRIGYSIRVPALARWVTCPVHHGPIWDFKRQGAEVSITAHGMEEQALGNAWQPRTFAKKSRKTTAIRALAQDVGYTRMVIPDLPFTFPRRLTVTRLGQKPPPPDPLRRVSRADQLWPKMQAIAKSMDRYLFFDGAGVLRLRAYSNRPAFTFDQALLSNPTVLRDVEGLRNIFEVLGANPKGPKGRVRATAQLPPSHPLSPQSLAMNGKPLYLAEREENDHFKTIAACAKRAGRLRDDHARTITQVGFDSLPIPCMDEMDLVNVVDDDGTFQLRMQQWTIPLGGSDSGGADGPPMTVGSNRRAMRAPRRRSTGHSVGHMGMG